MGNPSRDASGKCLCDNTLDRQGSLFFSSNSAAATTPTARLVSNVFGVV